MIFGIIHALELLAMQNDWATQTLVQPSQGRKDTRNIHERTTTFTGIKDFTHLKTLQTHLQLYKLRLIA